MVLPNYTSNTGAAEGAESGNTTPEALTLTPGGITRRDLFVAAAALLAGCGQQEPEPTIALRQGPTLEPNRIREYATSLQANLEKQGHAVTATIPNSASQLFVVVRYVHAPHSIEIADPKQEGRVLLENMTTSTVEALRISLRALNLNKLYADGMTAAGVEYFDQFMRLPDKQRSPEKITVELAGFSELRKQVEQDAGMSQNKRASALQVIDKTMQEWNQLKAVAAEFQQNSRIGPMYALALARVAVPMVSEEPALHAQVLKETVASANMSSTQTTALTNPAADDLVTLIRSGLKAALAANKDEAELFGSARLAKLQNQRESWLLAQATNSHPVSLVLMGAGHSFGDNITALGMNDRLGLIEIIPKKLVELAAG